MRNRLTLTVVLASGLALLAQAPSRSVWDGVYTEEQSKRGEAMYAKECGMCHGPTLEGIEMAPPLAGGEFLDKWAGQTVGDLFERTRKTMPVTKPGKLPREVYTDIMAFILSASEFPTGQAELARETQVMQQIRIDATKPEKK